MFNFAEVLGGEFGLRSTLSRNPIHLVFCDDRLMNGNYLDIVQQTKRTAQEITVIVVPRLGDLSDYLRAIAAEHLTALAASLVAMKISERLQSAARVRMGPSTARKST